MKGNGIDFFQIPCLSLIGRGGVIKQRSYCYVKVLNFFPKVVTLSGFNRSRRCLNDHIDNIVFDALKFDCIIDSLAMAKDLRGT